MPRTSLTFTIPAEPGRDATPDVHRQPTRIIRSQTDRDLARRTVVSRVTTRGIGCHVCSTELEIEAQFCGMCGRRVRARSSRIGSVIDGLYEVQAQIADGESAAVYRARYLPTGEDLALKIAHADSSDGGETIARFRREARAMSRARSPGTVCPLDQGETDDGAPYIAMELLAGERLDVRLRVRGLQPWRAALSMMRDLCGALEVLHAQGIVHRDVSPRSVMIGPDDAVKLFHFGLAKLRVDDSDEDLTRAGRSVGMLGYAAPELLAGERCDGRADLYGLGVIAWELIAGSLPRAGCTMPRWVPAEIEQLLRRCIAHDPSARYSSARELRAAIEGLLATRESGELPSLARHRRIYDHTSAFELLPPRIVIARGSEPDLEVPSAPRTGWRWWVVALLVGGIGLGTAVAGCV